MKYCNICGVSVAGSGEKCPLCQSELTNEAGSEDVFPNIPTIYKEYNFFFRCMMLGSIAAAVISVAVNLLLKSSGHWSAFVVGGIICAWVCLFFAVKKRKNIPKTVIYQVFLASTISVAWDLLTGWRKWSIGYVVPILCISAVAALGVLTYVLKWGFDNIVLYIMIDALFGIVPVIFILTNLMEDMIPSIVCVAGSLISMAAVILFKGDVIWLELKRRLHL
ncbi:MAG: DUF6320 domain-containing protein [Oscillospiraceae bacterium]|jgi:hypothetical protein|nr:DUF6320 domain-containing protein [Oscillospiraceae bacterium]